MNDTTHVRIRYHTYVTVQDSNYVGITNVLPKPVSYKYEAWGLLAILFLYVLVKWFKKPIVVNNNNYDTPTTHKGGSSSTWSENKVDTLTMDKPNINIDMSKVKDSNITNKKL